MTTWTVELPPGYSPTTARTLFQCGANARVHRMVRARITKKIRNDTKTIARGHPKITRPVSILAVQHPAHGVRACDADNIAPQVKAMIDGLRDSGVLLGDSPAHVTEVRYTIGARRTGSQLVLHLTEIEDGTRA